MSDDVKKRRSPSGPRPISILYKITDKEGNIVDNVNLDIVLVTRRATEVVKALQADRDVIVTTLDVA